MHFEVGTVDIFHVMNNVLAIFWMLNTCKMICMRILVQYYSRNIYTKSHMYFYTQGTCVSIPVMSKKFCEFLDTTLFHFQVVSNRLACL